MESVKSIVPHELLLNGNAADEFVIVRKTDGTKALVIKGDGTIVTLSEAQTGGSLGAVSSADATHLGLFGATETTQPTALTAAAVVAASFTFTAPTTADYLIQNLTQTTPFGFVTADEGNSVLKVIQNLVKRQEEMYAKLQALGVIA